MDNTETFKIHADSAGDLALTSRAIAEFNYGISIEVTSGPFNGIQGRYMGTATPTLRAYIKNGLPVLTTDADVDNPFQNMVYDDENKNKAHQLYADQQKQAQQTPQAQPAAVVQPAPATSAQTAPSQPAPAGGQQQTGETQAAPSGQQPSGGAQGQPPSDQGKKGKGGDHKGGDHKQKDKDKKN